jgi:hypothetical protein
MRWGPLAIVVAIAHAAHAQSAGWTGDRFELTDGEGRYRLDLGLIADLKMEPILVGTTWQNRQAISAMRPSLSGSLYRPWLTYLVSEELASNPPYLLDAYVDAAWSPELGFTAGQLKTPFCRSANYGYTDILFPDEAVTASYFWTGRDKGAMAHGTVADALQYWIGGFGGSPVRQPTTLSGNYLISGRVTWDPGGRVGTTQYPYIVPRGHAPPPFVVSWSLEGYYGKIQTAIEGFEPSSFDFTVTPSGKITRKAAVGADVLVQGATYQILVEAFARNSAPEGGAEYTSWGVWGQAGVLLVPDTLDIGIRANYVNPSLDLHDDTFDSIEAELGWYIDSPVLEAQLRYGLARQRSPGAAALGDVELPVGVVGTINVFTANLQLSF